MSERGRYLHAELERASAHVGDQLQGPWELLGGQAEGDEEGEQAGVAQVLQLMICRQAANPVEQLPSPEGEVVPDQLPAKGSKLCRR